MVKDNKRIRDYGASRKYAGYMSWQAIGLIWHLSSFDLLRDSASSCSCSEKEKTAIKTLKIDFPTW